MKVGVIGVGLIGGSIGKGLIESGVAETVYGLDTCTSIIEEAIKTEAIHDVLDMVHLGPSIDLWVVASPPDTVVGWVERIGAVMGPHAVITDTASVKKKVCEGVPPHLRKRFVGGHPMAGTNVGGISHSKPYLFADAKWILTPVDSDADAIKRAEMMIFALDAFPLFMSPEDHDLHAGLLSHVPNILANVLVIQARQLSTPEAGAGSWQDLTRAAGGDPNLWAEILLGNDGVAADMLSEMRRHLAAIEQALKDGDREFIRKLFEDGRAGKKR